MRRCLLFVLFTLPFSTISASAQDTRDTRDWYLHPFAGLMQLIGAGDGSVEAHYPGVHFRNHVEGTGLVYGVRAGRRVASGLNLEGGFRFSLADRMAYAALAEPDGSVAEPIWSNVLLLKGGDLFASDLGFKWNLRQKRFSPFLYAGGGSITRTRAVANDTSLILSLLARQQNQRWIGQELPARPTAYHLDFGAGGEVSMGRRWGIRFELRNRFEPNSYPDKARHFLEITAGPSFRF